MSGPVQLQQQVNLSIIIVTYNSAEFIGPCLKSLCLACAPFDSELIIVDNGSRDNTLGEVENEWPNATILKNSINLGFAAANNQGDKKAQGDYLLLLNADTVLLDQNLALALRYAEREHVAVLGPKMVGADGALQRTWSDRNTVGSYLLEIFSMAIFRSHFCRIKPIIPSAPLPVQFLVGAALLISRAAYANHGLFDQRFFFCCEERDLCYRYALAGEVQAYFPDWVICHYGGSGNTVSRFHLHNWIRTSIQFTDKHGSLLQRCLVRVTFPLYLSTHTVACLLKGPLRSGDDNLRRARLYAVALIRLPRFLAASKNQRPS